MNSRYERYSEEVNNKVPSRLEKNKIIYDSLAEPDFSSTRNYSNAKVIDDSPKEINIEKIKKYILTMNEEGSARRAEVALENKEREIEEPKPKESKVYDINSVLEKARAGREQEDYEKERYKKLRDTQFDILSKINMYSEEDKPKSLEEDFNTEERTLIDLINTVTMQKNELLSELQGGKEEDLTLGIEEESKSDDLKLEIEKQKEEGPKITNITKEMEKTTVDKSFYTNSLSFDKNDFEVYDELEKTIKKNNVFVKFIVFLLILAGLTTIVVVLKYVFFIELF